MRKTKEQARIKKNYENLMGFYTACTLEEYLNEYSTEELEKILIEYCSVLMRYNDLWCDEEEPKFLIELLHERKWRLQDIFEYTPENLECLNNLHCKLIDAFVQLRNKWQELEEELTEKVNVPNTPMYGYSIRGEVNLHILVPNKKSDKMEHPSKGLEMLLNEILNSDFGTGIHRIDNIAEADVTFYKKYGLDIFKTGYGHHFFQYLSLSDIMKINQITFSTDVKYYYRTE